MPPYQYQPFQDRFSGSIADIMARRGDVQAQGIARQGDIRAAGLARTGQIVGQGIQAAAAPFAQLPEEMQQLKARNVAIKNAETQGKLLTGEVEDLDRKRQELKALDQAYTNLPNGRAAVLDSLQKNNMGHLVPQITATFDAWDKAHLEAQKLRDEADAKTNEAFADIGAQIRDYGYDPFAAQLVISDAKAKYANDPQRLRQVQQVEAKLQNDPSVETVKSIVDPIINLSPKRRDEAQKAAELKRQQEADAARKADQERTDAETKRHNQIMESTAQTTAAATAANARTAGAREARERDVYNQTYGTGATNPDGSAKPAPVSSTAQGIAEYRIPPPSPRSMATGAGKALMDQVMRVNPSYDATQFTARSAMRKNYTSGNAFGQLTALNTAIEHLGKFDEVAQAMGNGSFKPGNEAYNWFRTTFGSSSVTNFELARDVMAGELATAMKKSGATDTEIDKVTRSLNTAGSPKQLADAVREIAIPMIAGKAGTMDQQWKQTMGDKDPFSVYTPGAKAIMDRYAKKPAASTQAAKPVQAGDIVTYQGKQYKVKSITNGQAVLETP